MALRSDVARITFKPCVLQSIDW